MNNIEILYEDNHLIVAVKPPNMLSQKDITNDVDILSLLKSYIKDKYHKPGNVYLGLVHRLDRPVGGIMVFARTSKAAGRLSKMFRDNEVEKRYLAIINGILSGKGEFNDYLLKEENGNTIVSSKGKLSKLEYEVIKNYEDKSLVKIKLYTGRHHQIRVQFASRGYPLIGDKRYSNSNSNELRLFSYYLKFIHPVTNEELEFKYLPKNANLWKTLDNKDVINLI